MSDERRQAMPVLLEYLLNFTGYYPWAVVAKPFSKWNSVATKQEWLLYEGGQ